MKTILIVNGENYWQTYFSDDRVEQVKIQDSEWVLKEGVLYVSEQRRIIVPDKILWRLGAIRPEEKHKTILEMIKISGIPCLNSAEVLLQGYDRLSMYQVMKKNNLPIIPCNIITNSIHLNNIKFEYPFVVKAGNFHGGYGKALVETEEKWQDVKDLLFVTTDYITIEPYISYIRDIRYLAIGDFIWAMARKGKYWKANVETTDFVLIDTEEYLSNLVIKLQQFIGADILAVDILEDKDGNYFFVEYNDIPGLSGFPDIVKYELAQILINK